MEDETINYMSLPVDDLQYEYRMLFDRYKELRQISETDAQRIHDLKRSLDTAHATEAYLCQELESLSQNSSESADNNKVQSDLEDVRRSHSKLKAEHLALQQEHESLTEETVQLRGQLKVAEAQNKKDEPLLDPTLLTSEQFERLNVLEQENVELLQQLEKFYENDVRSTMAIAEREKNVEILREQVRCLEENLHSKRDELEEKTQLLESAQEQLADANAKIAMLMTAPENNERKGNSLFAEVDDQRQVMKQLLATQKKSYMQMKKIFNESEYEIRRLKRENVAMHTELQACSSIFCNADKTYQDKLNDRIRQLFNQNEDLERKLIWTQERLKELAKEKGVLWLDSMFNFCKQETNDLKQQLHSVRIQKASMDEQLRNALQDMARWRFESLKSRCVLLDRENLLTDNKILFKPISAMEFNITKDQSKTARPRIVHVAATPKIGNEREPTAALNIKIEKRAEEDNTAIFEILSPIVKPEIACKMSENEEIEERCQLEEQKDNIMQKSPLKQDVSINEVKCASINQPNYSKISSQPTQVFNSEATCKNTENKENEQQSWLENQTDTNTPKNVAQYNEGVFNVKVNSFSSNKSLGQKMSPPPTGTLPGPSILCKQRDIFKEAKTNVKFCAEEPTVHNLSAVGPPSEDSEERADIKDKSQSTVQQRRTKSNIIVRRVFVGTKSEPS